MTHLAAFCRIDRLLAAVVGLAALSGCRVLTVEEDAALRARRGANFDAARYVDTIWAGKAVPLLRQRAAPADELVPAIGADLDAAGARFGRRVGEGSAWTFVISGTGQVTAVDTASRRGGADVAPDGVVPAQPLRIQVGPVISGTAIRDGLPFVAFNDFADQLAFAEVGSALTRRSLRDLRPALAALRPGQRIRFLGVMNLRAAGDPLVVTPVAIVPENVGG